MKIYINLNQNWELSANGQDDWLTISHMPMGVHEVLHEHKYIGDDYLIGMGEDSKWVAEQDWFYRCSFSAPPDTHKAFLHFEKLDTIARIVLNGEEVAQADDIYMPVRVDVSGKLKTNNELVIQFQSPYTWLKDHPLQPKWQGKFMPIKLIRKPITDFSHYLGATPYLTLIGIFGDVFLEIPDLSEIINCDLEATLDESLQNGLLKITIIASAAPNLKSVTVLYDPSGVEVGRCELSLPADGSDMAGSIPVATPYLWWPRGYGEQPLYSVVTKLYCDNDILDNCHKQVGFRKLRMALDFDLRVNGVKVRMWGSNLVPLDGKTHRWNGERAKALLDLAEFANMNTMRIWSEGEPFADELYEECDRRGILLWQELTGTYGMHPDSEEFCNTVIRESEYLITRLKHHPCIFMWCGGNEILMGAEYDHPGEKVIGFELFTEILSDMCKRLDPNRYYHPTSPYGGDWANDPRTGDTHGYEMWWYTPGMEYPVAFTEHMRVSGPALKSMRRWIPDKKKLWPEGFVDATYPYKKQDQLMPEAWFKRVGNSLDIKAGPVYLFRDADTPEELAFKYSAAHAKSFKDGIKRSRMGRPSGSKIPRISNAHLIWKFSDTWPLIYSAIIDYYLEPYIPYYEAKRSYAPVMVCFDIRDKITLWLVNDSSSDVSGTLEFGLFTPAKNEFSALKSIDASMPSGQSGEIADLTCFGQFRTENILYARFTDERNGIDYTNIDYVDIDRRLNFPDAKLTLGIEGDTLIVSSDKFARFVELEGNDDGDEFGWYFDDNYFDLMPGVVKKICITGKHKSGLITAKAHYSQHITKCEWK